MPHPNKSSQTRPAAVKKQLSDLPPLSSSNRRNFLWRKSNGLMLPLLSLAAYLKHSGAMMLIME
jgi:hypothetical protein